MKWSVVLTWLLLPHSRIHGAPQKPGCEFPEQWRGDWFQSGEKQHVNINGTNMSSKGQCVGSDGDKFLIQDHSSKDKCHRCIGMYEKHKNVLQYKETECMPDYKTLDDVCGQLRGDAILFSLFRINATPSSCPFRGPLEFTYSSESGECKSPASAAEACTQESRVLLRFQACHDVLGTESANVELECLATWKEGSSQYLVVRRNGTGIGSDEQRYRCFLYEKLPNATLKLAQSGDATCTGLTSTSEGARTFHMSQKKNPSHCFFPQWMVNSNSWIALEQLVPIQLLTSKENITIFDKIETQYTCHSVVSTDVKMTRYVRMVAKAMRDCTHGFVCLVFHTRDNHVIEMQQSQNWTKQPDEACESSAFDSLSAPYITFISSNPATRQCPFLGQYDVVSIWRSSNDILNVLNADTLKKRITFEDNVAELRDMRTVTTSSPRRCHLTSVSKLDIGCRKPDRMKFSTTSCKDETFSEYSCHGSWVENDTAYVVASTDAGRYCIVYSASTMTGPSRELSVTGHLASCPRASQTRTHEWQANLTSSAQCGDVSSASSWTSRGSSRSTRVLFAIVTVIGRCILR